MNMIEKVARAIFASEGMVYTDDERMFEPFPYDELDEIEQASFEHKAKAAIEAMREATPEMLEAALDWHNHVAADETYPMARGVIRAAVGAALEET